MLRISDFLKDLAHVTILTLLDRSDFLHNIREQVLNEHLCFFVTIHPRVNLNPDHFAQLVGYLNLVSFKTVNLVPDSVVCLSDFSPNIDLLLSAGHLLLPYPAVDTSDLGL